MLIWFNLFWFMQLYLIADIWIHFDFIVCTDIASFEDASNSPNISAESSRANSPDLSENGIKNASNFLEDETLKTCLNEADLVKEKLPNDQEELKTERKPLQETIGMIDVVKKCVDEEEGESGEMLGWMNERRERERETIVLFITLVQQTDWLFQLLTKMLNDKIYLDISKNIVGNICSNFFA